MVTPDRAGWCAKVTPLEEWMGSVFFFSSAPLTCLRPTSVDLGPVGPPTKGQNAPPRALSREGVISFAPSVEFPPTPKAKFFFAFFFFLVHSRFRKLTSSLLVVLFCFPFPATRTRARPLCFYSIPPPDTPSLLRLCLRDKNFMWI